MPSLAVERPSDKSPKPRGHFWSSRAAKVLLVVGVTVGVCAFVWMNLWPFQEGPVLQDLREASDGQVQVRRFQKTYFPSPGCVIEGLVFVHGSKASTPLITIEKLTIRGTYLGVLSQRVSQIVAEGMHISIPPFGSGETFHTTPSKITIGEIVANNTILDFDSEESGRPPLRFEIHEASLRNVGWKGPLTYHVKIRNPEPPGEVIASGKFGVWNQGDPGQTPVSGEYKFENADLGVYEGVAGTLSSVGNFSGPLAHIDISGSTDTPNFEVKSGHHPVELSTDFNAYVDGINGDTFLKHVEARFGKTRVVADGSVAKSKDGQGKTALINLSSANARIEDVLRLFSESKRAPMSGNMTFRGAAEIPPGDDRFLVKVKLRGAFGIAGGNFANSSTQEGVNKLSAGARGEKDPADPETALTDLTGQVALEKGTAKFSDLSFGVPGATARMHGIYNLITRKIDLRGQLQVDTKISNTTSGAKSFFLKVMDPFFKKRKTGEILPVRISGTYEHPSFGLDLNDKKAGQVAAPAKAPATKSGTSKSRP